MIQHPKSNGYRNSNLANDPILKRLCEEQQVDSEIQGIGICVLGNISPDGKSSSPHHMASEQQATILREQLEMVFHCPVRFVNNTVAPLLAERWIADDIPKAPSLLYVDEHLGFALYVRGQLVQGPYGFNMWLGRFQIDQHGAIWHNSYPGQLAASASLASITDQLAGYTFGMRPSISPHQQDLEIQSAYQQFEKHDMQVVNLFNRAFDHLGLAIRNLSVLFSPHLIILNGWTPHVIEQGIKRIQAILNQGHYDIESEIQIPRVRQAKYGHWQFSIGASIDITNKVLNTGV